MRALLFVGSVSLAALGGCGLENFIGNAGRSAHPRPASVVQGTLTWAGGTPAQLQVLDGDGNAAEGVQPFASSVSGSAYELRLPSASHSWLRVRGRSGNMALRALVPAVGEESTVSGVDLDARSITEAMIVEAWLSVRGRRFAQLTPAAYVGDGLTSGTRTLIRRNLDQAGPTRELLQMVERVLARANPAVVDADPDFFHLPVLDSGGAVTSSPLDQNGWLARNPLDYDGDGTAERDPADFHAKLSQVVALYSPDGCPDPDRIRVVFSVDFAAGGLDGNCATVNRFKWTVDKPGKQMFFVGWIHADSPIQDPRIASAMGAGVPNQVPMYDDGTNGDEVGGDNIWTIAFDLPRGLRVGYKYTWGLRGQQWTGSEEWPGNSRILEVADVNGDAFVNRRDVYGDEATNKDKSNLNNSASSGTITWTTDFHGCGAPEAREQRFVEHSMCTCAATWTTPQAVGPLTVACPLP